MSAGDDFYHYAERVRKKSGGYSAQTVEDLFMRHFSGFPNGLGQDLYDHFGYGRSNFNENAVEAICTLLDLFNEEYDPDRDNMSLDDWDYVKESVNDFALELPESLITHVMSAVVEKGVL